MKELRATGLGFDKTAKVENQIVGIAQPNAELPDKSAGLPTGVTLPQRVGRSPQATVRVGRRQRRHVFLEMNSPPRCWNRSVGLNVSPEPQQAPQLRTGLEGMASLQPLKFCFQRSPPPLPEFPRADGHRVFASATQRAERPAKSVRV
jgi:hypothetical protein